jgi:hypothetical protein
MSIEQAVLEKLRTLPTNKQQEVLDFVEFLQGKLTQAERINQFSDSEISALEAAQHVLGVIGEGPADLSTNKRYMEGYGQ